MVFVNKKRLDFSGFQAAWALKNIKDAKFSARMALGLGG